MYKVKPGATGAAKIDQLKYIERSKSDKVTDVLVAPESVIADASSAQKVGKGSLLRVEGQANQYIAFGDESIGAPGAGTQTAVKTPADFFYIVATDEFVRTSAAMRIEVIED